MFFPDDTMELPHNSGRRAAYRVAHGRFYSKILADTESPDGIIKTMDSTYVLTYSSGRQEGCLANSAQPLQCLANI